MASWFETLDTREVYAGFSRVRVDTVRGPDGAEHEREVVEHDDAVAVVPIDERGHVLLLRQYRHPVGGYVLEIPAGALDVEGEDAEAAARRELREELHHDVGELVHLHTFWNSAGWSTERTHVYLGTHLRHEGAPDGFEAQAEEADMEVVGLPLADAVDEIARGAITDAKTVIGILLASGSSGQPTR